MVLMVSQRMPSVLSCGSNKGSAQQMGQMGQHSRWVSTANGSAQQMGQHSRWVSTADGSAQQMDWHSRSGTDLGQVEFFYTYEQI